MNVVMIVPTGIGAEIGGHAGDATPAAKLLASVSDTLVLHPNIVNASDINEMPDNALYVDGYMLDRFLEGEIDLKPGYNLNILVAVNSPVANETINAVSAARVTIGAHYEIMELDKPLRLIGEYAPDGTASGEVLNWESLVEQVKGKDFDALAVATLIEVDKEIAEGYLLKGGVNPWGGVEAKASRLISAEIPKPVAHAPIESEAFKYFNEVVDPRMAAEVLSETYLHSVLKGLHRAPQIGPGLSVKDIDFLVSPFGCWGRPHKAALAQGVHIIINRENKTVLDNMPWGDPLPLDSVSMVDSYIEAAGVIAARRAGIIPESVRRPLAPTVIK